MASFTKLVCFFFLLTTLQTFARDSQFFSQVTRNRDYNTNPNPAYYNHHQENQATPFSKQQEEEEPTFVPQTTQVGYGLYGHETGLDAPTTTTTTAATTTTNPSESYNMDDNQYDNQNNNNINNYENVAPRRYVGGNNYNNNNKNGHGEYYGGVGYNGGGVERQGMSDTRYLENGKYYYDINAEKMSNPTYNNYNNDLSYNTNFENNLNNNDNNNNNNDNVNGVYPGYQSKFPKQDEFEFDDQP